MDIHPTTMPDGGRWNREPTDWNLEPGRQEVFGKFGAALYTTDPNGLLTWCNEAAVALWGRRPRLGRERWCGAFRLLDAHGSPLTGAASPMAVALRELRPVRGRSAFVERPDGTLVPVLSFPTPIRDGSGAVVAGFNILLEMQAKDPAPKRLRDRAGVFAQRGLPPTESGMGRAGTSLAV